MTSVELLATHRLVAAAKALRPEIVAAADQIERDRRIPLALVQAVRDAGLFRLFLPASLGGEQVDPLTAMHVIRELAWADGSLAWCVMVGAQASWHLSRLNADAAAEFFGPNDILAGAPQGGGRAIAVDGGYRVTGQWPFASGSPHATWFFADAVILNGDAPRIATNGLPERRIFFFRSGDFQVLDTWYTTGLRGTGSHDVAVADAVVPDRLTVLPSDLEPCQPGPLYRWPWIRMVTRGAHALGIARRAIDTVEELAATKKPSGGAQALREQPRVQSLVAEAEAMAGSAELYLEHCVCEVWDELSAGRDPSVEQRARVVLAIPHAVHTAVRVVETMYRLGGSTAIYSTSVLDRCFRDVNTAAADIVVAPRMVEAAGQVLLGLDPPPGPIGGLSAHR
jgi:indole-3-acetate monooxygenase